LPKHILFPFFYQHPSVYLQNCAPLFMVGVSSERSTRIRKDSIKIIVSTGIKPAYLAAVSGLLVYSLDEWK
jgi:hypothetical protein